jgi:hypothetical protein
MDESSQADRLKMGVRWPDLCIVIHRSKWLANYAVYRARKLTRRFFDCTALLSPEEPTFSTPESEQLLCSLLNDAYDCLGAVKPFFVSCALQGTR